MINTDNYFDIGDAKDITNNTNELNNTTTPVGNKQVIGNHSNHCSRCERYYESDYSYADIQEINYNLIKQNNRYKNQLAELKDVKQVIVDVEERNRVAKESSIKFSTAFIINSAIIVILLTGLMFLIYNYNSGNKMFENAKVLYGIFGGEIAGIISYCAWVRYQINEHYKTFYSSEIERTIKHIID